MKSAPLSAALLIVLAPCARAGQQFSFSNPIASPSYDSSLFQTGGLFFGNTNGAASILNVYTGTVTLTVDNFSNTGTYIGSDSRVARYYLTNGSTLSNISLSGTGSAGAPYATGAARIVFVNPVDSTTYFQVSSTKSQLSYTSSGNFGTFTSTDVLTFSGAKDFFNTTETGNENAAFTFLDSFAQSGNISPTRHSARFYASIGTIGNVTNPTPEPSSLAALSLGALALLRRRRRV